MSSLEQSIANLVAIGGQNLNLPQQVAAAAQNQINAVGAAYTSRLNSLLVAWYVNQATGLDTNPGTLAAPLKSIERALELSPRGAMVRIYLQSDYAISAAPIAIDGRRVRIGSADATRYAITPARSIDDTVTPNLRRLAGFDLQNGGGVIFYGVRINIPALEAPWSAYGEHFMNAFVSGGGAFAAGLHHVAFASCDISMPATIHAPLLQGTQLWSFATTSVVLVGAATSLNGKILGGYTAAAGTATSGIPGLVTSLATV